MLIFVAIGLAVGIGFVALISIVFFENKPSNFYKRVSIVEILTPTTEERRAMGASNSDTQILKPTIINVIIGHNNTVIWVNRDNVYPTYVKADDELDVGFYNATHWNKLAGVFWSNETFGFTFTKPGEYNYHSHAWPYKGKVVVDLP